MKTLNWKPFTFGGATYNLAHLNPCAIHFERPGTEGRSGTTFNVDLIYSLHCFAREIPKGKQYEKELEYSDARETRLFDLKRYEYSKLLPGIVESLANRHCRQTGRSNYITVECLTGDGKPIEYDVFFTVSRSSKRGRLNLFIQSAYIRDDPKSRPPSQKPIRFLIILHNTLNNRPIRP